MKALLRLLALLVLPAAAAAETHTILIDGLKFEPATLTVKRGDKVVWRNMDVVPHTATAPGWLDSGQIPARTSWTWTAGKPGRIAYICTYHPGMKATVIVQ